MNTQNTLSHINYILTNKTWKVNTHNLGFEKWEKEKKNGKSNAKKKLIETDLLEKKD